MDEDVIRISVPEFVQESGSDCIEELISWLYVYLYDVVEFGLYAVPLLQAGTQCENKSLVHSLNGWCLCEDLLLAFITKTLYNQSWLLIRLGGLVLYLLYYTYISDSNVSVFFWIISNEFDDSSYEQAVNFQTVRFLVQFAQNNDLSFNTKLDGQCPVIDLALYKVDISLNRILSWFTIRMWCRYQKLSYDDGAFVLVWSSSLS